MADEVNRRTALKYAGGAFGVAAFAALAYSSRQGLIPANASADPDSLSMSFYSEGPRAQLHLDVIRRFERDDPEVSVAAQYQAVAGYDDKLSTQMAGGNQPDIFELHQQTFSEYVSRGVVRQLDDLVPGVLPFDSLSNQLRVASQYNGHWYGIPLGVSTTPGIFVDKTALSRLGLAVPDANWTLADFEKFAGRVRDASGGAVAGSVDMGGNPDAFTGFIAGYGKVPFSSQGGVAFSRDQLGSWFELWDRLRKDGSVPPMKVTSGVTGFSNDPVVTGRAVLTVQAASKALTGIQPLTKNLLGITTFPRRSESGPSATSLGPIEWFALSAKLEAAKAKLAAQLCMRFVDNVSDVKTLDLSHGVPLFTSTRAATLTSANPTERLLFDAVSTVSAGDPAPRATYPPGASEFLLSIAQQNEELGYRRTTLEKAVDQVFSDADRYLTSTKGARQ